MTWHLVRYDVNKMGCFNDPAWKVCGWVGGGVADTNYIYPAGSKIKYRVSLAVSTYPAFLLPNFKMYVSSSSPVGWSPVYNYLCLKLLLFIRYVSEPLLCKLVMDMCLYLYVCQKRVIKITKSWGNLKVK